MNWFSSNQMRQHVESTKNGLSYFGLINGEMSWSDKETPVHTEVFNTKVKRINNCLTQSYGYIHYPHAN
jgi:hypothetical protein